MLDRNRESYATLAKWFRVFLRFALAGQLISYGLVKAVPLQMPFPYLGKLVEPFGDFSPMGVLWSSIGVSPAYETFAGCAELLGGVLLIFPRTTMLGALISLADMIQVFTLNMTYDVPVKLLSFHLILLSLLLLAPDLPRLARFFLFDRKTEPSKQRPLLFFCARESHRVRLSDRPGVMAAGNQRLRKLVWMAQLRWRIAEISAVRDLGRGSIFGRRSTASTARWRQRTLASRHHSKLLRSPLSSAWTNPLSISVLDFKETEKTLTLSKRDEKSWSASFVVERPSADQLTLDGTMDNHHIHMETETGRS